MFDQSLADNPLTKISSLHLFLLFLGTVLFVYLLAWKHRDVYDPTKLIKQYALFGLAVALIGFVMFKLPAVIVIGIYLLGAVVLLFRSNHYFHK